MKKCKYCGDWHWIQVFHAEDNLQKEPCPYCNKKGLIPLRDTINKVGGE